MQKKPTSVLRDPTVDPVYLAADVVASLIQPLPAGTAYFIGVVLLTMMTGRLVQCKGSLARAALPFVFHLKWGWHRVERAMERGKFSLDDLFDRADTWCVANLPVEPVQLGVHKRKVVAVDSSDCPLASDGAHGVVGQRVLAPGRAGGAGQHRGGRHPGRVDRWGAGRLGPAGPLWGQLRRGGGRGVRGPAAQRGPPAPRGRCGDCDPEAVCRRHGPGRADGPIAH